jgi:hypothetical protein
MLKKIPTKAKTKKEQAPKTPKELAEEAVAKFEELRADLDQKQREFEEAFPDANVALKQIEETRNQCYSAVAEAKGMISKAKITIGEFKFIARYSSPSFDGELLLKKLCEMKSDKEAGATLKLLLERGVISSLSIEKSPATLVREKGEPPADLLKDVYVPGGAEVSGAVHTPTL